METEPIEGLELTPDQQRQWEDTMSLLGWKAPGFRHIFYKLLTQSHNKYYAVPTKQVPYAATDAKNIMINPDSYFKFNLMERVFVAAHEVVHNVYGDVELLHRVAAAGKVPMNDGTFLPFDNEVMQKSMDYRINALLVDSRIGTMPKIGWYDPKIAGANDSVLDVYAKMYKKKKEDKDQGGKGDGPGGFDQLMAPGKSMGQDPAQAAGQRNQQQWAVELAQAQTLQQARDQGKMAGALQRMFKDILEPQIPWIEKIAAIFARKVGSGAYNWKKPDRRFIVRDLHMPSRSGHQAGWIVIWGDTSGSIGSAELNKYLGELAGIIEDVRPRRLTILWCDARIHRIDEVEEVMDLHTIKAQGVGGGGGTSVHPCFEWIDKQNEEKPDVFIGFTDGYVTFPKVAPSYHVIWAAVADTKFPWGDVVRVK